MTPDPGPYELLAAEERAERRRWRWALVVALGGHLALLAVPIPEWGGAGAAAPLEEVAAFRLQPTVFAPPPPPEPTRLETEVAEEAGAAPPQPAVDLLLPDSPDRRLLPPQPMIAEPPEYPDAAWQQGDGGVVILRVLLDQGGGVVEVEVEEGPEELAAAAVAAVRRWSFMPASLDGIAVPAAVSVRVRFAARG